MKEEGGQLVQAEVHGDEEKGTREGRERALRERFRTNRRIVNGRQDFEAENQIDLSDISSVRKAVQEINSLPNAVDILINDAAVVRSRLSALKPLFTQC